MSIKENNKRPICSICGSELLKNPNISCKPYAVRKIDPIICDFCINLLFEKVDEDQEILETKQNLRLLGKSMKSLDTTVKKSVETANIDKNIDLAEIISNVTDVIKGQDEHVKTISTAIFKNQRIDQVELKSNLILLGDSGSGKTEIIKLLANEFKLPYIIEDATRYTEAGYVGASIDDMIYNLYKAAGSNIAKAQKGILVIDEGDKKGAAGDVGRDVSGESVLFSLLKIIEGSNVPIINGYSGTIGYLDTSKLTIVFIGAFPKLVQIREKRLKKKGVIGFGTLVETKEEQIKDYIAEDFIAGGFPKEFVGRFDTIVELNKLTTDNLVDIILNSKKSTFMHYVQALEAKGIKLVYTDEVINEIAAVAQKLDIGARGIKKIVQEMFKGIMYNVLVAEDKMYTECFIEKQIVHDSSKFILA